LSSGNTSPARATRRLDQWLWFARFVKSRSLAAQLCTAGAVAVNGVVVKKADHAVRIGDAIAVPQGAFCRTVRVMGLGARRGPATEARGLYEETAAPVHLSEIAPAWEPLLADDDPRRDPQMIGGQSYERTLPQKGSPNS
jgi:ribosome-associated heat shock protein Hsp15